MYTERNFTVIGRKYIKEQSRRIFERILGIHDIIKVKNVEITDVNIL